MENKTLKPFGKIAILIIVGICGLALYAAIFQNKKTDGKNQQVVSIITEKEQLVLKKQMVTKVNPVKVVIYICIVIIALVLALTHYKPYLYAKYYGMQYTKNLQECVDSKAGSTQDNRYYGAYYYLGHRNKYQKQWEKSAPLYKKLIPSFLKSKDDVFVD